MSGLEGDSFLIKLFKPSTLAPLIGIIGIVLYMGKNEKRKGIGVELKPAYFEAAVENVKRAEMEMNQVTIHDLLRQA